MFFCSLEARVVKIEDVSIEASSGWRALDAKRVAVLRKLFEDGEYGVNILRKPSLVHDNGSLQKASDGLLRLSDGKHTFAALREVAGAVTADPERGWSPELLAAIAEGVSCQVVAFAEPEELMAFNVAAHDVDSNTYKPTSIKNLVCVVNAYRDKIPGGC